MSLSRALAGLRAATSSHKWSLLGPAAAAPLLRSAPLSTSAASTKRTPKKDSKKAPVPDLPPLPPLDPSKIRRPSEIPFQPKVANSVHLVGTVGAPVLQQAAPTGECMAVSILVHEKSKDSEFWIPVIFQGDLAQIAACHLKEDDLVYITGQLSGDASPLTVEDAQTNIQIFAHSLSFVENNAPKDAKVMFKQDKMDSNCSGDCHDFHGKKDRCVAGAIYNYSAQLSAYQRSDSEKKLPVEEDSLIQHLWDDLLSNPHNWWDNRTDKINPSYADFKHKKNGQLLWVNEFTPERVLARLDTLFIGKSTPNKRQTGGNSKDESLWKDLLVNPQNWKDNRTNKLNGTVKPRYPDFSNKVSRGGLWLDSAPGWVLSKLGTLDFCGSNSLGQDLSNFSKVNEGKNAALPNNKKDDHFNFSKVNKGKNAALPNNKKDENEWKDLSENPNNWWDNRLRKQNPKAPDFKHKNSGVGLWLNSCPSWVLPKLPPATEGNTGRWLKTTILS